MNSTTLKLRRTCNRLFAAFLMLTAVPFFATEATTQQTTDTALATHLTQMKTELEAALIEIATTIKTIPEDYEQEYKNIKNEAQALYNFIQNNFSNDIDESFNALCNQMQSREAIVFSYTKVLNHLFESNFINNHKEEIKTILSNFINNYKEEIEASSYKTHNYDPSKFTLEERIVLCFMNFSGDRSTIFAIVIMENTCNSLLQKIDAKIAELA
jgi:hypothetical protein